MMLLLGGTAEARALARSLEGLRFTSSLAGRVARPRMPVGETRIGGFGGVDGLRAYLRDEGVSAVVDEPEVPLPPAWTLLQSRGPYDLASERSLLAEHDVDVVVTKDSGGEHTVAKLDVAAERGAAVVVVRRPAPPEGVETVSDVDDAAAWARARS